MTGRMDDLTRSLESNDPERLRAALEQVASRRSLTLEEKRVLANALTSVFSRLQPPLSTSMFRLAIEAQDQLATFGADIAPFLVEEIARVDIESAGYLGKALAKLAKPGLDQLRQKWDLHANNTGAHINLIQAVAYQKMPDAIEVLPLLLQATHHENHSVRAKALYTFARLIEKSKGNLVEPELVDTLLTLAFEQVPDANALVRKNAVTILGQLTRRKLLSPSEEKRVHTLFVSLIGKGEHYAWDSAFVVRQEAERFMKYCSSTSAPQDKYKQSFRILQKRLLCNDTFHFVIEAPYIARKIEPGQFIIVRPHALSERIPLSICGWDRPKGTIEIIVSTVGKTSFEINHLPEGSSLKDVVGPLGERSRIPERTGTCVVVGGGYGTGAIIPTAADLKKRGQRVVGIVGARNKASLIMVDELRKVCDEVIVTTNDGSRGREGLVTDALAEILAAREVVHVLAVGPVPMMKAIGDLTRHRKIETFVSLNAIMVDGTGMCGACRVSIGKTTKFACIHGPDFDAHQVDFENLMKRQKMFVKEEKLAFELITAHPKETVCEHH
jgi:ferredoxin/flavodoxin---NADP+ reductase